MLPSDTDEISFIRPLTDPDSLACNVMDAPFSTPNCIGYQYSKFSESFFLLLLLLLSIHVSVPPRNAVPA